MMNALIDARPEWVDRDTFEARELGVGQSSSE
jgi:hypothetical protein